MEEWKEYKLGDVCSHLRSGKGIKADSVFNSGKYPVIGGNGVRGYADVPNFEGQAAVIGRQGAYCGNVRFFEGEAYMTEHAVVAVGNELADTRFLACLLSLMHLGNLSAQSAQPGISVQTLSKQPIRLPSISYQKKVSAIIKSLDDKIEVNRRINDNLEQQAQALFKSWFVDFEPFRDQPFVESELGMIPEGWRIYSMDELVDVIGGYSYKGEELKESQTAMATIKNFERDGGFKTTGFKEIIPSPKVKPEQFLSKFDIMIAHTDLTQNADIIGNPALLLSFGNYKKLIMSMDLVKTKPKNDAISFGLLYSIFADTRFKSHALGYVNGTTVLHLSKKAIPEYRISLPDNLNELALYESIFDSIFRKESEMMDESRRLAELRDTLLPRLMSGELSVDGLKGQFAVSPGRCPGSNEHVSNKTAL